jgi:signal peptidase I
VDDDNIDNLNKFRSQKTDEKTRDYLKSVNEKHAITLKPNQYFVMGDNKRNSVDSRSYGAIDISNIISVVEK